MPTDDTREVTVVAHVPPGVQVGRGAVLRARVDDISAADRAAPTVGSVTTSLEELPDDGCIELTVPVADVDSAASYAVFVHLDTSGSGEVDVGDAITTTSYPVLTHGAGEHADVQLQRVGGASSPDER